MPQQHSCSQQTILPNHISLGRDQCLCTLHMLGRLHIPVKLGLLTHMFWTLHGLELILLDPWFTFAHIPPSGWRRLEARGSRDSTVTLIRVLLGETRGVKGSEQCRVTWRGEARYPGLPARRYPYYSWYLEGGTIPAPVFASEITCFRHVLNFEDSEVRTAGRVEVYDPNNA